MTDQLGFQISSELELPTTVRRTKFMSLMTRHRQTLFTFFFVGMKTVGQTFISIEIE